MRQWAPLTTSTLLVFLSAILGSSSLLAAPANLKPGASKSVVLQGLSEWRAKLIAQDEAQSSAQKKHLTALSKITLKQDTDVLEAPLLEITRLDDERVELEARRRIVDQIIFSIDTKWAGTDLKGFLETQLLELAANDLNDPGKGGWWKFLIQASVSLREIAEPGSDPVRFLEFYMAESGVLDPKPAKEIIKLQNYVR